jgi:hypothetical protein
MAKSALITLTTAGADTGPFNLLSNVDSYVTPFETNIAKSSLVAGYTTNLVPDAATIIRLQSSNSFCTNYINLTYPTTTTTSTTSTTTTPPPTTTTTTTTTTTSTTTTTTTAPPATIYWVNRELASPYVDSDLSINDDGSNVVSSFITETGSFIASAGSSIASQQDSQTGTLGSYRLLIRNITDSVVLYDNTTTPGSIPATVNTYTFTAASGKSYHISASAELAPTTTTTSTTTTSTTPPPTTTTTTTTTTSTTTTTTTVPCYEYIATAGQTDIDNSDDGNVYFNYTDCSGTPQILSRGTTTPSNPVCARSVGSVYILVGGNQSVAGSSSWSVPGTQCN